MTKFANFSTEGLPLAFYSEEVHGTLGGPDCTIPTGATRISDEDWLEFISNQGERRWDGSAVVEYVAPIVPQAAVSVSDRQFFQALAIRGEITEEEALEAVGPGIIPAAMLTLIEQLPEGNRFGAKMLIRGATVFERHNPLAELIGTLFGWDADKIDDFWAFAATL